MNVLSKGKKELLSQRGAEFADRDVTEDDKAVAELDELGYLTTPVTVIDGEVVVSDRERFELLLVS